MVKEVITLEERISHLHDFIKGKIETSFAELVSTAEDKVDVIVGGGNMSGIALAMAPMTERAATPFISTEGSAAIVNPVKVGGGAIPNNVVIAVLGFIFLYFMSVVLLTFVLILSGLDFMTALGAVLGNITNAGPGLGKVGPGGSYAELTDFQTWVCSFTMLLGRLEVLSLAVVFTPQFWRK